MPNNLIVLFIALVLAVGLIVGGIVAIFQGEIQAGAISVLVGCGVGFWLFKQISNG